MTDRRRRSSLRTHFLSRILLAGLVPLVVLAVVTIAGLVNLNNTADRRVADSRQQLAEDSVAARLSSEAASAGREIERAVDNYLGQLTSLASESAVVAGASDASPAALGTLIDAIETEPGIVSLTYTDRTGLVVGTTGSTAGDIGSSDLWQGAWADRASIGSATASSPGTVSNRTIIPMAVRIDDVLGVPVGVLTASVDVEFIQTIADYRLDAGVSVAVLTPEGILLTETESGHDEQRIGRPDLEDNALSDSLRQALRTMQGSLVSGDGVYGFVPVTLTPAELDTDVATGTGVEDGSGVEPAVDGHPQIIVVASQPAETAFAPLDGLEALRAEIYRSSRDLAVVVLIVLGFACLVAVAIATMLSRQIITPISKLTARAREVADNGLPRAVADLLDANELETQVPEISIEIEANNELSDLVTSFNSVQTTAIDLAGEQARQRSNALQMFANLGRRNQSLVKRQLRIIDELESSEDDPERLDTLFKLDHLATRLRRSAESFLVIAGDRSPVGRSAPVRIELMVQGALAEVEHYRRVDASELEPAALTGRAVGDVAHIMAELVENALSFSPPESVVELTGRRGPDHYTLSVTDRGIGLPTDDLAEANQRLSSDVDIYLNPSSQLGLIVVAKLAARYGITIELRPADQGGIESIVSIPNELIEPAHSAKPTSGITSVPERPEPAAKRRNLAEPIPTPPQPPTRPCDDQVEIAAGPTHQVLAGAGHEPAEPTEEPEPVVTTAADHGPFSSELSSISASMITEVHRRPRRRLPASGDQIRSGPRSKRAIASTASIDQVASEAEELRQRWQSFQNGRRRADSAPHDGSSPGSQNDHHNN